MIYFKKRHRLKLLLILLAGLLLTFASAVYALDPPHDTLSNCDSCHSAAGLNRTAGGNLDNTPQNLICDECHNPDSDVPKVTHSATETKTSGKPYVWNSTWTYECRVCHNPHYQKQTRMHPDIMDNGGAWVHNGTIAQLIENSPGSGVWNIVTVDGDPGWFTSPYPQLVDFILQPDTNEPFYYRIVNNSNNSLTLSRGVETMFISEGDEWGVAYGKMMKTEINSHRPIEAPGGFKYNSPGYNEITPWRQIVYLLNSGNYSQVPPGDGLNPTTRAVCVVCHTRTKYNNVGYAVANGPDYQQTFDTTIHTNYFDDTENDHLGVDYTSGSTSCWDATRDGCHKPPESGFDAGATCGDCHGKVIGDVTNLTSQIKNANIYSALDTGNATPGAHSTHPNTLSDCKICHSTGMLNPDDSDAQIGNFVIDMSFEIPGTNHNGGTYYGRWPTDMVSSLTGEYQGYQLEYAGLNNGTQNGTMACENVYCHAGIVNGTVPAPEWDDTTGDAKQCGACHKANSGTPSDLGKHEKHIGISSSSMMDALPCDKCHPHLGALDEALHVNGYVNWTFPSYPLATYKSANTGSTGTITDPTANEYGTCSSLYCHSNGVRAGGIGGANLTFENAFWNASSAGMGCSGCHAEKNSGSPTWSYPHGEHMNEYDEFSCTDCHDSVVDGNTTVIMNSLHMNGATQVVFNSVYEPAGETIEYSGTTCSNIKCHSTGVRADLGTEVFSSTIPKPP
jgi:predicted CxxxxCH...CXXCH cytochrome family protein